MRAIVLGGGLGGMIAARLLAARGAAVTILDAGPALGAGWRSVATPHGPADLGLRVPRESGIGWADALVFHDLPVAWHRLGALPREAHVVAGRVRGETGCLDARFLDPARLATARAEVIARAALPDPGTSAANLATRWHALFGPTLLDAALRPACRSLLGAEPETLAPTAAQARLPVRLVLAETPETERLHRLGHLAARLAHPRAAEAPAAQGGEHLYPRQGGIGTWIAALEAALLDSGVRFHPLARLDALVETAGRLRAVRLADGAQLAADLLVLAAPPTALPGTEPMPAAGMPVTARLAVLEGGAPPPRDWLLSYDPATVFLRLGFPDRLEGRELARNAPWRVIAEMRSPDAPVAPVLAELGLLPQGARVAAEYPLGTGRFAVETLAIRAAREAALAACGPALVLRGATGGHALAAEIIADAASLALQIGAPRAAA